MLNTFLYFLGLSTFVTLQMFVYLPGIKLVARSTDSRSNAKYASSDITYLASCTLLESESILLFSEHTECVTESFSSPPWFSLRLISSQYILVILKCAISCRCFFDDRVTGK